MSNFYENPTWNKKVRGKRYPTQTLKNTFDSKLIAFKKIPLLILINQNTGMPKILTIQKESLCISSGKSSGNFLERAF